MKRLLLASMLLLLAPVARGDGAPAEASQSADDSYLAAYNALKPGEIESKKIDALPQVESKRIEVKQRVRSASFGHKISLVVPITNGQPKREYYVEYGRSTNRPAEQFGPFSL